MLISLLIALTISIEGGWESISIDNEQINSIKSYLDTNLPHLFPEIEQNGYSIKSAKMQIVNGMNLKLIIKAKKSSLVFKITLFVDNKSKVQITKINRLIGSRPTFGGYNWQSTSSFTANDYLRLVQTIQKKVNLVISKEGTVLVYRTQVVKGMKSHIIFRDSNQNLFAAVISRNILSTSDDLVSVYQIFWREKIKIF